jgi:hypothetical protein
MMSEREYISNAARALGDRYAAELRACEEVLKTESDVGKRRVAQARYLALTEQELAA